MTSLHQASDRHWRVTLLVVAPATLLVALAAHPFIEGRVCSSLSVAQFYIHGLAAVVALWPLAYVMRTPRVPSSDPSAATIA